MTCLEGPWSLRRGAPRTNESTTRSCLWGNFDGTVVIVLLSSRRPVDSGVVTSGFSSSLRCLGEWSGAVLAAVCVSQLLIIVVCARVIRRLYVGVVVPSAKLGKVLYVIGGIYLGLMCLRLIIGLTVLPDHFWFGAILPTLFHLVLASFILVYGRFHVEASRETRGYDSRGVA